MKTFILRTENENTTAEEINSILVHYEVEEVTKWF